MFQHFLVCGLMLVGASIAQNSPVYMWGSSSFPKPTLQTVSKDDFAEIVLPKLKDSMILVFLENGLENQDFSMCQTESKGVCFVNLRDFESKNYLADVELPVKALKDLSPNKQFVKLNRTGDLSTPINYETGKIVFLDLDHIAEDRSQTLFEHDSTIAKIYENLSNVGKVFGVYTSEAMTLSRRVRAADLVPPKVEDARVGTPPSIIVAPKSNIVEINGPLLMAYKSLTLEEKSEPKDIKISRGKATLNERDLDVELTTSDGAIKFKIHNEHGYWRISEIEFENNIFKSLISAGDEFSYYCGKISFIGKENKLMWNGLQLQPNFNDKINTLTTFSDPWHCVGFTSAGIWMGLFVSFLFLFIISIGVTWLMSINTMDRFDDPKGKTITINAGD